MKKIIVLAVFGLMIFTSCAKRHTCPTYLQNTPQEKDIKVQKTAGSNSDIKG